MKKIQLIFSILVINMHLQMKIQFLFNIEQTWQSLKKINPSDNFFVILTKSKPRSTTDIFSGLLYGLNSPNNHKPTRPPRQLLPSSSLPLILFGSQYIRVILSTP